jgi:DNA-binding transcriptional ArsR family regulator
MDPLRTEQLRRLLRLGAPRTAHDLAVELRVSQPTVSRQLAALGDEVLRLGRARNARYTLVRPMGRSGRLGARWPLFRVDAAGRAHELGHLAAAGAEGFVLQPSAPRPVWAHGAFASGWFDGLPWFLDDLRPQGFLGRAFARRHAAALQLNPDPTRWSNDEAVTALLVHGGDGPGDLVLGEAALREAQARALEPRDTIAPRERARCYPQQAQAALAGEAFASSAGGEQPKFTITLRESVSDLRSCIVKFSDRASTPAGQRWADLLRSEAIAATVMFEHGLDASRCEILESDGRVFLEVTRLDRTPVLGRRGLVSLRALDAAFHGHGAIDWWRYAPQLEGEGWIGRNDARRLEVLGLFGALIGNGDMHLANVSLVLRDERPLALAPAYDMLPMRWAPAAGGEVVPRSFDVLPPLPAFFEPWRHAAHAAVDFWQRVHEEPRISAAFAAIAADAGGKVEAALARLG